MRLRTLSGEGAPVAQEVPLGHAQREVALREGAGVHLERPGARGGAAGGPGPAGAGQLDAHAPAPLAARPAQPVGALVARVDERRRVRADRRRLDVPGQAPVRLRRAVPRRVGVGDDDVEARAAQRADVPAPGPAAAAAARGERQRPDGHADRLAGLGARPGQGVAGLVAHADRRRRAAEADPRRDGVLAGGGRRAGRAERGGDRHRPVLDPAGDRDDGAPAAAGAAGRGRRLARHRHRHGRARRAGA